MPMHAKCTKKKREKGGCRVNAFMTARVFGKPGTRTVQLGRKNGEGKRNGMGGQEDGRSRELFVSHFPSLAFSSQGALAAGPILRPGCCH